TARGSREVAIDRIRRGENEPQNWLVYGGTYRSLRHTALDQINVKNVRSLQTAWAFQLGIVDTGLQSTPLVADGVMYVTGADQHVYSVDAATGRELWHYKYEQSAASKG